MLLAKRKNTRECLKTSSERLYVLHAEIALTSACLLFVLFLINIYCYVVRNWPCWDEIFMFQTWQNGKIAGGEWPLWAAVVPYFFYHYFGTTSLKSLQLVGMCFSVAGAAGVNYLVLKRVRLDSYTKSVLLIFFNVCLLSRTDGVNDFYYFARLSVLEYPTRIFAGFFIIYLLIAFCGNDDSRPSKTTTCVLGLCMTFLVYAHHVLVLSLLAMWCTIVGTYLLRRPLNPKELLRLLFPFFLIFVVPLATGILVLVFDPHYQITEVRKHLYPYYFRYNDNFEKTVFGYAFYVLYGLKEIAYQSIFPTAWFPKIAVNSVWSWLPIAFVFAGTASTLYRRDPFRAGLASFILLDILLLVTANEFERFPFGCMRYALAEVFTVQLMAGFGIAAILRLCVDGIKRCAPQMDREKVSTFLFVNATLALATLGLFFGYRQTKEQMQTAQRYQKEAERIVKDYGTLQGATFLTTADIPLSFLLPDAFFTGNTVLQMPQMHIADRKVVPKELLRVCEGATGKDRLFSFTLVDFNERVYKDYYQCINDNYEPVKKVKLWNTFIVEWRARSLARGGEGHGM